jgi:hypothetical protein
MIVPMPWMSLIARVPSRASVPWRIHNRPDALDAPEHRGWTLQARIRPDPSAVSSVRGRAAACWDIPEQDVGLTAGFLIHLERLEVSGPLDGR